MNIIYYWRSIVEILILWYCIYMILVFIKGTRTEQLLKGLIIVGLLFVFAQQLRLDALNWVLSRVFPISIIALVLIFQPELRHALARLGEFGVYREEVAAMEEIVDAALELSQKKKGAIIAIEREVGLRNYAESGTVIDARISKDLIAAVFMPTTPLHDGAMIIRGNRISASGVVLPLSQESKNISKNYGTRHRAALGLTEESDAVCIVVSEETGNVSLAVSGRFLGNFDRKGLLDSLSRLTHKKRGAPGLYIKTLAKISPSVKE